jgi:betaine-aldehyde dehydrogenase
MNSSDQLFINGTWLSAVDGATREIFNPATNEVITLVSDASLSDTEKAIHAARTAFDSGPWPRLTATERATYLFKLADLIEAQAEALAMVETRNSGKPLREARYDVADASACFRYYAGLITKPSGETYAVPDP